MCWETFYNYYICHFPLAVTLFGQDWQVAFIQSHCSYSTLFQDEIMAYVHVRVGLKSVNITLEGELLIDYTKRVTFLNLFFKFLFRKLKHSTAFKPRLLDRRSSGMLA